MKLSFYELKKVLNKKIFYIVLALCLVINCFLLYTSQNTEENSYRLSYSSEYAHMIDEYSAMPSEQAKQQVDDELLAYEISSVMKNLAEADNEDMINEYSSWLEDYEKESPEAYKKALELNASDEDNLWENLFLFDISSQFDYIDSYPDFIEDMFSRADSQSASRVFGDEGSFSYKNLYKTAEDYAPLGGRELNIVNSKALTATTGYSFSNLFAIAVVLLVCACLFGYEKNNGLYSLVRCTRHGRLKTVISKLIALFLLSTLTSFLFTLSDYSLSAVLYGATDLSVNIQSISEFRNCTLPVTAGEFLLLFALAKAAAVAVISAILALVFVCFSSSAATYLVGLGAVAAEYLLYTLIGQNSYLENLKYINLFYILDAGSFLGSYLNLNLFSNAVTAVFAVAVIFAVIFVACAAVTCAVFCVRGQHRSRGALSGLGEKFKTKFLKISGSTSLFGGESFKFTVQNKMAVLLILLAVYAVISSTGSVRYPYLNASDGEYKAYMEYLEGDITEEKESYIAEEQKYFDGLHERIDEIQSDESLSDNTKQAMTRSIENIIKSKGEAFERVKEQYARLLTLKESGVNARFIDENLYSAFASSQSREWTQIFLLLLVLLIALPYIFAVEYKNKMIDLVRPTPKGKLRLYLTKLAVAALFVLFAFLTVYVPYYIKFINTYGTNSLKTPLVCLFENAPNISVLSAAILTLLAYFMLALISSALILALSVLTKSNMFTMALSIVILIVPCLAAYSTESARFGYAIANGNTAILSIIIALCVALSAVLLTLAGVKFTNTKLIKKE